MHKCTELYGKNHKYLYILIPPGSEGALLGFTSSGVSRVKACSTFRAEFHHTEDSLLRCLSTVPVSNAFSCTGAIYTIEHSTTNSYNYM